MSQLLFLIASHTNPGQVLRLVKALKSGSPECQIVIHHDRSKSTLDSAAFALLKGVHIFENPIVATWGEFSVVELELRCIDWILKNSIPFDWLILLSGQDYPIQPIQKMEQFLSTTEHDGFIEHFPAFKPSEMLRDWHKDIGTERYCYRYYRLPSFLKWLVYKLYRVVDWQRLIRVRAGRFGAKLAVRRRFTPFTDDFECYAGSQWHTLSYQCVDYIHKFVQNNSDFVNHYRTTMIPDESFFQTILLNNHSFNICPDNLRYVSWQPPYPAIMQTSDFEPLIHSGKFFARKFDEAVDDRIFSLLDQSFALNLDQDCENFVVGQSEPAAPI
ncbi:beta-1,6-N-acetylglucosaminyltransferase [Phormidesmis priestleyi]|uniref:beta-1,6-N-acetylglucosaminyltransferase n=1 Tax=Phormidesmis priestleyi TaxID=268141 RepID=UPI000839D922|nr:beta-1,6-N-acetylglucosaminyltransferase [Phormidesmis priestleyi]